MTPRKKAFFITADSTKLYYEVYGDSGPVIVLTYGIACLMNHWHFQVEHFSKTHQVLMYDLRGHHKSDMGENLDISIDLLAQDALDLFKHAFPNEPSASFWGHSFGAPISFRCASLEPAAVSSIVFVNGFYKNPFSEFLPNDVCNQLLDGLQTFVETAPSFSQWLWAHSTDNLLFHYLAGVTGGFNLERIPYKDVEIYSKGLAYLPLLNFCYNFRALINFNGAPFFEETQCPALIVHGARDGIVPEEQNRILAECLPNVQFLEFPEGSHCTQLDLPFELNLHIDKFLRNMH